MLRIFTCALLILCIPTAFTEDSPILIDGSSTVYPITAAMGHAFEAAFPGTKVTARFSGSSSGFRKLTSGEIAISGASRPIKSSELETAAARGIELIELPVAYDGITVVINKNNSFLNEISVSELQKIWQPESTMKTWADVRSSWPAQPIKLFGPGKDSGTFEYFTKSIVGKAHASRTDVVESEDDGQLVQGVVADDYAIGYFGWAYYLENQAMLKPVAIATKNNDAVMPSHESILDGSYQPLSRPIFIYVNKAALTHSDVRNFVNYYLNNAPSIVEQVGYVPLGDRNYQLVKDRFQARTTGSVFTGRKGKVDVYKILKSADAESTSSTQQLAAPSQPKPIATAQARALPIPAPLPAAGTFSTRIDDLRDACLGLSQKALSDRTTLEEIEQMVHQVYGQVSTLKSSYSPATTLGGR